MSPSSSCPKSSGPGMPKIMIMIVSRPRRSPVVTSGFDEGAMAVGQRAERLVARRRSHQLIVVPRTFAFRRLLYLEQVRRNQVAAILADLGLAEAIVLDWHRLHAVDGGDAVLLRLGRAHVRAHLQVVQRGGVVAGM